MCSGKQNIHAAPSWPFVEGFPALGTFKLFLIVGKVLLSMAVHVVRVGIAFMADVALIISSHFFQCFFTLTLWRLEMDWKFLLIHGIEICNERLFTRLALFGMTLQVVLQINFLSKWFCAYMTSELLGFIQFHVFVPAACFAKNLFTDRSL